MTDFNGADPAAFDHDGDGHPGGSKPKRGRPPKADQADINADLRARAAKQAAKALVDAREAEMVTCRVLPMGDGKISMGQHITGIGEVHYERGEEFAVALPIAQALEARGYVEIK